MLLQGYELIKETYLLLDDGDQRFLDQYNLTPVQFYTLLWLEESPKNMSQLSKALLCDPSNVTRVAGILERKELITRQRDKNDRRVINLQLTEAGQQLCQTVREAHNTFTQQRMTVLNESEQTDLINLLYKLGHGLRQQLESQS